MYRRLFAQLIPVNSLDNVGCRGKYCYCINIQSTSAEINRCYILRVMSVFKERAPKPWDSDYVTLYNTIAIWKPCFPH